MVFPFEPNAAVRINQSIFVHFSDLLIYSFLLPAHLTSITLLFHILAQ